MSTTACIVLLVALVIAVGVLYSRAILVLWRATKRKMGKRI